jgi:cardiolipin hydrolase
MESKTLLIGLVIGIALGGVSGYAIAPQPDIPSLDLQIDELESSIATYQTQNDDLQVQISSLEEDREAFQSSLSEKDAEITRLTNELNQLGDKISELEAEISNFGVQGDFIFVDASFSRIEDTSALLGHWIGRANQSIRLMVMLITHDGLADALMAAHDRGVEVDVIIDSDWRYSTGSVYGGILDAGVDIRGDDRGGLMHHKVMVVDGYVIITGSYNWSSSAEDSNDENCLVLKSRSIAEVYLTEFDRIWDQTTPGATETGERETEPVPGPTTGFVVINEVEANPAGADEGNEWVELYNPSGHAVDIGGWMLSTTHGSTVTLTISEGTVIDSGQYLTFSYQGQWIDNEEERVLLVNSSSDEVDATPYQYDAYNDNRSWQRYPDGYDSDSMSDWVYKTSTKGQGN